MNRFALIALVLLTASSAQADWKPGDILPASLCAASETMAISNLTGPYFSIDNPKHLQRQVLTCTDMSAGVSKRYIIESEYDAATKTYTNRVHKAVDESQPEALLVQGGDFDFSSRQRAVVSTQWVDASGAYKNAEVLLYTENNTAACPAGSEIKTLEILRSMLGGGAALGTPVATGLCAPEVQGWRGPINGFNILDQEQDDDGTVRVAAVFGMDANEIAIIEYKPGQGVRELARVNDPALFAAGCGQYFMAARLLPGGRVALAYKTPKLLVLDYTDLGKAPLVIHDGSRPGGFSTCEGYLPAFDSLRSELWIHTIWSMTTPGAKTQELFFRTTDASYRPVLVSFPL